VPVVTAPGGPVRQDHILELGATHGRLLSLQMPGTRRATP
jgi:hypothetical protein